LKKNLLLRVSRQDVHQRAFSGTTGAHDGRQLPRWKETTHALEYRLGFCNQTQKEFYNNTLINA